MIPLRKKGIMLSTESESIVQFLQFGKTIIQSHFSLRKRSKAFANMNCRWDLYGNQTMMTTTNTAAAAAATNEIIYH